MIVLENDMQSINKFFALLNLALFSIMCICGSLAKYKGIDISNTDLLLFIGCGINALPAIVKY